MKKFDTDKIAQRVVTDGYAIVPNVIKSNLIAQLEGEIDQLISSDRRPKPPDYFSGFKTIRYFDLLNAGPVWASVATHQAVLDVVYRILGHDCLLSVLCTALVGPRQRAQMIHCDDDIYGLPRPHPHLVVNTVWALSDFKHVNGATRVVEGSHLFAIPPPPNTAYATVPLEMRRGSIAFILGTTYHGAGANLSEGRRDALLVNYCAGIMRQQENFMLEIALDTARTFSPTLQRLIGYGVTRTGAGFVGFNDPQVLVQDRKPRYPR
jgi:ectoine hydroxylase-related dioxygenase (phytanoyl-CoA dioxygenase family)